MAAADNFQRDRAGEFRKVELGALRKARQIHDAENDLVFVASQKGEDLGVVGEQKFNRAARKCFEAFAHRDDPPRPPKQRGQILLLIFDVDRFVVIFGIDDDRQMQLLRIRQGKTGVTIGTPLHRRPAAVAIAEVNIIAHADLVAVINDRRAGHRHQHRVE